MLLSLAEPAENAEKDEIDLWPEFRDRRILSTLHALRAEVFNNLHLYLLIIFMFSIASSFSVMPEWFYRAPMRFSLGAMLFPGFPPASTGSATCGNDRGGGACGNDRGGEHARMTGIE